jgi:hypothetical protein
MLGFHDTTVLNPDGFLSKENYKELSEGLALDEILTDAAHRFFL